MKKLALAAVLATLGLAGQANAAFVPIAIDPDGAGAQGSFGVTTLNWLAGNSLTLGAMGVAGESAAAVGAPRILTTVYQAQLNNFVYNVGGSSSSNSLSAGEWTVVATIAEYVAGIGTATASLIPQGGTISVYYDATKNANDVSGTGYNDGKEILRGTIVGGTGAFTDLTRLLPSLYPVQKLDNFNTDDAPGVTTHVGSGQSEIKVDIGATAGDFYDSTFFLSNIASFNFLLTGIEDINDTGQLFAPFNQANPSDLVAGYTPRYSPGNINGGDCAVDGQGNFSQTCDFQFQTLNVTSFNAVPEPASLALVALGMLGLGMGRRNRKS